MDYQKYLKSDAWREIRLRVWRKARGRCSACAGSGNHVHHKTYVRVGQEHDSDLELLCKFCHDRKHGLLGESLKRDYRELTGEALDTSQFPFGLT